MNNTLFLNDGMARCLVSPVSILSILDAHKRRKITDQPVIGILFGERENDKIYIKEAYPILSELEQNNIAVNAEYLTELIALLKRAYRDLSVVGLYSTSKLNESLSLCYEFLSTKINTNDDLILLSVDTSLVDDCLDIAAYCPPTIVEFDGVPVHTRYERIPVEIHASDADKIALAACASDSEDIFDLAPIQSDLSALRSALDKLSIDIDGAIPKLDAVAVNDPVIYSELVSAAAEIPTMGKNAFDRTYGSNLDDMLLVTFLASLTRTQVALSDNANAL